MTSIAATIGFIGTLVFLAHLFAALAGRWRIPDVLLLVLIGIGLGPASGAITPATLGALGPVFTTLTLIVILFEGGIQLKLDVLVRSLRDSFLLTAVNYVATVTVIAAAATAWLDLELISAFTLGAILGGASPAVVIPLIRHLELKESSRTTLVLESALGDVVCIIGVLALVEAFSLGEVRPGEMVGSIMSSFLFALAIGCAAAVLWSGILHKVRTLQNSLFTTPAFVLVIYGIVELLGCSGVITALSFGVVLGNIRLLNNSKLAEYIPLEPIELRPTEKAVFSEAVFLLKTFFFVYLGVSIRAMDWNMVGTILLLVSLLFMVRIPAVGLSIRPTTSRNDAAFMAAMVPKGLASVALAWLPLQAGLPGAETIARLTYGTVVATVMATAILVFLIEKTRCGDVYRRIFSRYSEHGPANRT